MKMMMTLVIAFGVQTTASAQFGGLLKKAKQAVEKKVTSTPTTTTSSPTSAQQATVDANGGITIKHKQYGNLLGTYYPAERKFVTGNGLSYIIAEDGSVKSGIDGSEAGKITDKGFSTSRISWMEYNSGADQYQLEGYKIGEIKDQGGVNIVTLYGKDWMVTSAPIDHQVLAYLTYGVSYSSEQLKEIREANESRERALAQRAKASAQQQSSGSGSSSGSTSTKMKSGDRWELRNNEQIYLNGSFVATVKSDGRICDRTGYPLGELKSDGSFKSNRYNNGSVTNSGDIKNNIGYPIGKMKSDGSLWENNGPCIGNISSGANRYIAAYAFFIYDGR